MDFNIDIERVKELFSACVTILALCGITFEVVPIIKINPISAILKWLGKKLLAGFSKDIKDIKYDIACANQEINRMSMELDEYKCEMYRNTILDYACSIRMGVKHTHDQFTRIFKTYENYNRLIEKRNFKNEVLETEYAFIKDTFNELMKDGSFRYQNAER